MTIEQPFGDEKNPEEEKNEKQTKEELEKELKKEADEKINADLVKSGKIDKLKEKLARRKEEQKNKESINK